MRKLEAAGSDDAPTIKERRQLIPEEAEAYRDDVIRKVLSGEIQLEIIPDSELDEY